MRPQRERSAQVAYRPRSSPGSPVNGTEKPNGAAARGPLRRRMPPWTVELGIGQGRPPTIVHVGGCHMAGTRQWPSPARKHSGSPPRRAATYGRCATRLPLARRKAFRDPEEGPGRRRQDSRRAPLGHPVSLPAKRTALRRRISVGLAGSCAQKVVGALITIRASRPSSRSSSPIVTGTS
ncbi:DUF6233 domain-containing protein, partial [Streptomyces sp. NPDC056159]|uniref:DUF6233 domain-containing protein n=1 Tax=Streptomyces sp. NPDC056159 TaxID=3155537 RepID=UPI00342736BB